MSTPNGSGISNVIFHSINRSSPIDEGYILTSDSAQLQIDSTYGLAVTMDGGVAPAVWIDWNGDGDFTDSGEDVVSPTSTWYPTFNNMQTVMVDVPSTATLGITRMRVYGKSFGTGPAYDPCAIGDAGGDVEDYTLEIVDPNALSVSPTMLNYTALGGSEAITISTANGWTISNANSWLTLSALSGSGNSIVDVVAIENTSISSRNGYITIDNGIELDTVFVTQEGASTSGLSTIDSEVSVYLQDDIIRIKDPSSSPIEVYILDAMGSIVAQESFIGTANISIGTLPVGVYHVRLLVHDTVIFRSFRKK
jgi:hypothetical protein